MDVLIALGRLVLLLGKGLVWLLAALFGLAFRRAGSARRGGTHGSARWATWWELLWGRALGGPGVILGRGPFGRLVRYTRDGMVMIFANTGTGKGLNTVIPTLLTYPGSMVVTDPKGENYAITARDRAKRGRVLLMNPLELGKSAYFNPMDMIRQGSAVEVDDAAALARLLVKPDAKEAHWDDKAVTLAKCLVLHALYQPPEHRTLAYVRKLSGAEGGVFIETLTDIAEGSPSLAARDLAQTMVRGAFKPDGSMTDEFSSVLSNLDKSTELWADTTPSGKLGLMSTFRMEDLAETVTTLYIAVPEEFLNHYGRWMRVIVGCVLNALTRQKETMPAHKVMLLLDEVKVLGRLDQLEQQAGLLRAYCLPVLIWQNLPQIYAEYKDGAEAFLATATCRAFFGTEDNRTGEYIAAMLGNTTTLSSSMGVSQSSDAFLRQQHQQGQAESGYWLLDQAEVQRQGTRKVIIKMRGVAFPLRVRRIDYRKVLAWKGRWDNWRTKKKPKPPAPYPDARGGMSPPPPSTPTGPASLRVD